MVFVSTVPDILLSPVCNTWRCPLGACLKADQVCDGIPHCRDRSDEIFACRLGPNKQKSAQMMINTCTSNQFQCSVDNKMAALQQKAQCIPKTMVCDGVSDCPNGEDERNCPADTFYCLGPGY